MRKNRAIVLGLCPTGLGVVRSLGRTGISVIGFDYKPDGPGFFSKYVASGICPNPYLDPDGLCEFLIGEGKKLDEKGVVFPTSDEFVLFLSRYREKLSPYFLFSLPSLETIEALLNKRWQYEMAEKNNVPYPQTFYPESRDDIQNIQLSVKYPAMIKPCYTHLWKDKGFKVKGFKVENGKELEEKLLMVMKKGVDVIVQSIIPGPVTHFYEVCSYLDKTSKPLCVFIKRKLRQFPVEMGLGSVMESVRNDILSKMATELFCGIKYHGPGEIEFKKDSRDGVFKMIEINARLTLQNSLADYCGVNFPLLQYQDLLEYSGSVDISYKVGAKWIWSEIDFETFKTLKSQNEMSFYQWLRSCLECDVEAIFSWSDPFPFLKLIKNKLNVQNILEKIFERV